MDKKDLRILELLAQNCRLTNQIISKAVNISKDAVKYRIKNLEENKVILNYALIVNNFKLGFNVLNFSPNDKCGAISNGKYIVL